jgi:glycosyltransferase involved in cell wall biosynthesis
MEVMSRYLVDCSPSLINRTAVHFICRDLVEGLPSRFPYVRHWRLLGREPPDGIIRKILGRMMLAEIDFFADSTFWPWPEPLANDLPTVFTDPLYVLRAKLAPEDVVLCHDLGPVSHPELFGAETTASYSLAYRKIAKIGPGLIFVSRASMDAFTKHFGTEYRFLRVIPLYARPGTSDGSSEPIDGLDSPFLLTVGGIGTRKNQLRCVEAYGKSDLAGRSIRYVICGPREVGADKALKAARSTPGVMALDFVSDRQLRGLYGNALGFVLPSLLEGFGMPILEAARYGVVSLVSAGSALQEAAGESAIVVDPLSIDSICGGLQQLIGLSDVERTQRSRLAKEQANRLTRKRFLENWSAALDIAGHS